MCYRKRRCKRRWFRRRCKYYKVCPIKCYIRLYCKPFRKLICYRGRFVSVFSLNAIHYTNHIIYLSHVDILLISSVFNCAGIVCELLTTQYIRTCAKTFSRDTFRERCILNNPRTCKRIRNWLTCLSSKATLQSILLHIYWSFLYFYCFSFVSINFSPDF